MSAEQWTRDRDRFRERRATRQDESELREIALALLWGIRRRATLLRWRKLVARLECELAGKEPSGA